MRLKPVLGLYRRALVNLLIACNAGIKVHNCSEFAQEYLELLKQLKRGGIPPNERTRLTEKHAYEILKAIEMEEAELEKAGNEGEDEGEVATGAFKKLQIGEHSGTEGQMEIDRSDDLKLPQVSSSRAKSTSTIEGMYTDDCGIKTKAGKDCDHARDGILLTIVVEGSAQLITLASKSPLRKRQA